MILLVLLGITLILGFIHLLGRYNESYWKKRGVVFYTKNNVVGPFWEFLTKDRPLFEIFGDVYKQYPNEPAVGIASFLTPALYVKDPKNLQFLMQTDFTSFNHRGIDVSKTDLLADNILFMYGNRWKIMRQHMTPLFTSTKLKGMYYIINKSAQDFVDHLKKNPQILKGNSFDTLSTFCSAAIGAAFFGITTQSTYDSPFLTMARAALAPTPRRNIKFSIASVFPSSPQVLGFKLFEDNEKLFIPAIKQVIRQREKENVKRHDFADICVSLQKMGKMKDPETGLEMEPTDEILAAQAFFFFIAGVEPTATAIFSTVIELGKHPEIQQRVLREVDDIFQKYNGILTYEAVSEMEYLEKVLNESFRMHPPIGFLTRECVRDTVLPVGNIKVDKGTRIFMPVFELHHDPRYYENPEVFDPERFAQDSKSGDYCYQPFGKANRICIGMRYAKLQVKSGLVHILHNFSVNTIVTKGGKRFSKQQVQVRSANVDVEFIPRKKKSK